MNYTETIKDNFNRGYFDKAMAVNGLPDEYPAWTIKRSDWYGVAVPASDDTEFSEKFSNARIWTFSASIGDREMKMLALTCSDMNLRNEFALICDQFVQPGENGEVRSDLVSHPEKWWQNWKVLLGNRIREDRVYPVIAEMMVMEMLLDAGQSPVWSGIRGNTHDIETSDRSYEVKSTVSRYGYDVEISSIYQLDTKPTGLDLVFMRFERSSAGRTIDDLVLSLVSKGMSEKSIEDLLAGKDLEKGCTARLYGYRLLEMKVFPVDDDFPYLTTDSFTGGVIPPYIKSVKYTVDLSGTAGRSNLT